MQVTPSLQVYNFSSTGALANGLNRTGDSEVSLYTANNPRLTVNELGNVDVAKNLTVQGNIYIKGTADAEITSDDFWSQSTGSDIFLTAIDGNVAIGITNASYKLDVAGDINFTGTLRQNGTVFSGGSSQWSDDASNIYFDTGNVGIGTNSPSIDLHIYDSSNTSNNLLRLENANSGTAATTRLQINNDDAAILVLESFSTGYTTSGSAIADGARVRSSSSAHGGLALDATLSDMTFWTNSTERMVIKNGGNIGIGTNTPEQQLTLYGSSFPILQLVNDNTGTASNNGSGITLTAAGDLEIGTFGSNDIKIITNLTEKMRINSSGNVGIGTNNPIYQLEAYTASGDLLALDRATNSSFLRIDRDSDIMTFGISVNNSEYFWYSDSSTKPSVIYTDGVRRVTVDTSGNVGIGTTDTDGESSVANYTPKMTLQGDIFLRSVGQTLTLYDDSTTLSNVVQYNGIMTSSGHSARICVGGSRTGGNNNCGAIAFTNWDDNGVNTSKIALHGQIIGKNNADHTTGGYLSFETSANGLTTSEYMRINSNGRIDMGTSVGTLNGTDPEVVITGDTETLEVYRTSTGAGGQGFAFYSDNTSTGTLHMQIEGDGDIKNTNNSYGSISDISIKQQITDSNSQWDDIKDLRVVNYKLNREVDVMGVTAPSRIGLVAQEAELISPGIVKTDEETGLKGVKYSVLYMKAVKALQEAISRIEDLESQNVDMGVTISYLMSQH